MTRDESKIMKEKLRALFGLKKFAVLSTCDNRQPYANLVAFVEGPELEWILFATERGTRKFRNLSVNHHIALLIENSINSDVDIESAVAVTITGVAEITEEIEKKTLSQIYLTKHPYLEEFIKSDTCALIKLWVEQYVLVENFNTVSIFNINAT